MFSSECMNFSAGVAMVTGVVDSLPSRPQSNIVKMSEVKFQCMKRCKRHHICRGAQSKKMYSDNLNLQDKVFDEKRRHRRSGFRQI